MCFFWILPIYKFIKSVILFKADENVLSCRRYRTGRHERKGEQYVSFQMAVEEYEGLPRDLHNRAVPDRRVSVHVHNHTVFYPADNR